MNEMRKEVERKKLDIVATVICTGLLAMFGMIFWMRDSVVRLSLVIEMQAKEISKLNDKLADVTAQDKRLTKVEIDVNTLKDWKKERTDMEGLR